MRKKLLALLGVTAVALVGAVAFAAGPAQAATPATGATSVARTTDWCDFPEENQDLPKVAKKDSVSEVQSILPQVLKCIEVKIVDMCDGRTVVTLTNWAKVDATWTRLTVEILGVDYVVKGGPDHTPVVITLGPPGIEDVQAYLVFEGEHDGTSWRIEKAVGDPYSWELPEACPTASPSPSVTVSVSPSPVVVVTTTTETEENPPAAAPNLPTTGDSLLTPAISGGVAVALGGLILFSMWLKRRRTVSDTSTES